MRDCVYKALFVFFVFLFCLPPIILGAFDIYLLSMQWPPGYCYQNVSIAKQCRRPFPQSFTIHGLWPKNNSPCPQAPSFSLNEVTSDPLLASNMKTLWPNLLEGPDEDFWNHEWEKHGARTKFSQHDYFQTTCDLVGQLNPLLYELQKQGMFPGKSYPLNCYKKAIESAYNLTPRIACNTPSGTGTTSNAAQMFEIRFCVDPTAVPVQFINCSWCISKSCGNYTNPVVAFPDGRSYYEEGNCDDGPSAYMDPTSYCVDGPSDCEDGLGPPDGSIGLGPPNGNGAIAVGLGGYFQFWVAVKSLVLSLIFQYVCF